MLFLFCWILNSEQPKDFGILDLGKSCNPPRRKSVHYPIPGRTVLDLLLCLSGGSGRWLDLIQDHSQISLQIIQNPPLHTRIGNPSGSPAEIQPLGRTYEISKGRPSSGAGFQTNCLIYRRAYNSWSYTWSLVIRPAIDIPYPLHLELGYQSLIHSI